ncbi:nucleotide exchange factor GrpE [Neobacillus piezotolerans]|uniref:Nucleotide exchange factor GrpE n=1 Tax=Neobacillus piezotolerans TaxID=2259171 RepID=A0A3D8GRJ2_9BACI|nr:nucleotide exchange factor GrpE [Neobacillus piezotolerans]RDU37085.1 nucleotide exchange factor GrpE [Neobacillus piezotolerans]
MDSDERKRSPRIIRPFLSNSDRNAVEEIGPADNGPNIFIHSRPEPFSTQRFDQPLPSDIEQGPKAVTSFEPESLDDFVTYQDIHQGIAVVNRQIKLVGWIAALDTLLFFLDDVSQIRSFFFKNGDSPWQEELARLAKLLKLKMLDFIDGGDIELEKSLQEEFIEELLNLPKLEQFYVHEGESVEMDESLVSLIEAIKVDVKKGNRANFKGLQELEMKFDQFVDQIQADKQGEIHKAVQEMKDRNKKGKMLALEMFDQIDSVFQAVQQLGNDAVTKQVEMIINRSLEALESYGFEEIKVLGEPIDGKTMISLGNVSRQQYAPDLEQYHVYSVHKRGFRDKETNEIIRKATVITVD